YCQGAAAADELMAKSMTVPAGAASAITRPALRAASRRAAGDQLCAGRRRGAHTLHTLRSSRVSARPRSARNPVPQTVRTAMQARTCGVVQWSGGHACVTESGQSAVAPVLLGTLISTVPSNCLKRAALSAGSAGSCAAAGVALAGAMTDT